MNAPGKFFHGLGGYLHDLYQMATCQLNNPHSYLKFMAINQARKATRSVSFVETGTYLGGTAYRCAKVFQKVWTIELDPELARRAGQNLKSLPNVELIQGDAIVELAKIFANRQIRQAIVFLDGHFSGGDTASGTVEEPAIQELEILGRYRDKINGIIIDDFRNFGEEPGHPPKWELLRAIEKHFPRAEFAVRIQNDQVIILRRIVASAAQIK